MNTEQHPLTSQLMAYLTDPDAAGSRSTGLHLAACAECRVECGVLSRLRQQAGWIGSPSGELSDEITDLFDDNQPERVRQALRQQIKQDPQKLRGALHYASHHVAMRREFPAGSEYHSRQGLWPRFQKWSSALLQFEMPMWKLLPIAAVLMAVFTAYEVDQSTGSSSKLVRFQNEPVLHFVSQTTQPGIGFFANQKQTLLPFDGVEMRLEGDRTIAFSWPAVDRAVIYRLKLQMFRDNETVILGRSETSELEAIIDLPQVPGQYRYEWILSGDTIDRQSFQASGGFVVAQ